MLIFNVLCSHSSLSVPFGSLLRQDNGLGGFGSDAAQLFRSALQHLTSGCLWHRKGSALGAELPGWVMGF